MGSESISIMQRTAELHAQWSDTMHCHASTVIPIMFFHSVGFSDRLTKEVRLRIWVQAHEFSRKRTSHLHPV